MTLADRIMILNKGRIEQFAPPDEIYNKPASVFVAEFIGSPPMNILESADFLEGIEAPSSHGTPLIGIRPEHIRIVSGEDGFAARTVYREDLGSHSVIVAEVSDGQRVRVATPLGVPIARDEIIRLDLPHERLHFFDAGSGARIDHDIHREQG